MPQSLLGCEYWTNNGAKNAYKSLWTTEISRSKLPGTLKPLPLANV
jgi:hypothetical protein